MTDLTPPPPPPTPPPPPDDGDTGADPERRPPVSRRRFLTAAGGVAGAAAVGGGLWAVLVRDGVENRAIPTTTSTTTTTVPATTTTAAGPPVGDRVLVVVEMAGGNDALNTVITPDGRYRDARPTLAIPEAEVVPLAGVDWGLHPALAPLAPVWDAGSLAVVAGVGMDDQTRSHFTAMDTWWSGVPGGGGATTGWLGRWLDATLDGEEDPFRAIALGGGARALVGTQSLATVVASPATFALRTAPGADNDALVEAFLSTAAPLSADPALAAAQSAIPATLEAVEVLASVAGDSDPAGAGADTGNTITDLLDTAAGIIDLGLGTRVITVGIGGFDTHAGQLPAHENLLTDVGAGIAAFLDRLEADGHADRVMVVTTSEFGRRVAENGSAGTDHGTGGCQFVLGPAVAGGQVVGGYDLANQVRGDLPAVVDTRSVYSAALDWLGGPTDELLDGPHDRLGLLST